MKYFFFKHWLDEQWDYFKFWVSEKWEFLKWHFKNMFETDMTSEYTKLCMLFDYDKVTFRPFKEKLIYRVTCWREFESILRFNIQHLQDSDLVGQQIYVLSKELEAREEHEAYMKLGSDLEHQELV